MSVKRVFFGVFQKLTLFCCAIFFCFSNAFSANLPSGYTELEYIESTGTQYIDTGIAPDETMDLDLLGIKLTQTSGSVRFGSRVAQNDSSFALITTNSNQARFDYGIRNYEFNFSGTYDRITFNHTTLTATAYRNGVVLDSVSFSQSAFSSIYNIYLFAFNSAGQIIPAGGYKVRYCKLWKSGNLVRNLIPAKRNSDNEIGMYDTVNNVFYQNAGTGEFTAGPVVVPENAIKIATTAYNTARFSPVVTDLNSTVATIRDVVTNTINQTAAIADLQATKQTRPADDYTDETNTENCPKFRQCLLVEDNNNTPHWYLIKDPVRDLVKSLRDNKINNAGETTTTAFAANGYDGTVSGTVDSRYYKGYPAMRLKTSAASSSVYTRQFSSTLLNGANGGQYKTLGDQEWAVTWDGAETGTADSFLPGVIYGTSRCVKTSEAPTTTYAAKVNPGTAGWTLVENSDALNDLENIEQYMSCYCKMTGVGVDGEFTPVRDSSRAPWVFDDSRSSAALCARVCAYSCADSVRAHASFRSAVLGFAAN